MTGKKKKLEKYLQKFDDAKEFLVKKFNEEFSSEYLSSLLGHYFNSNNVHEFLIFHEEIDSINLKVILENEIGSVIGEIKFDSQDFKFISIDSIEKAKIKENGRIWIIHNSDRDPKPSKPHAHNYESNLKLHLGTGEYYRNDHKLGTLPKTNLKGYVGK